MVPIVQGALLPGTYKVDHIPILQYVPWYGRQLKKWGEEEYEMLMRYMSQYKSQMVSGERWLRCPGQDAENWKLDVILTTRVA